MTIRDQLYEQAMARGLRQSTVHSYRTLMDRLDILDLDAVSPDDLYERLWNIDNPNTRRAAVIACRTVLGVKLKIPKGVPRVYTLPDEDTLRIALMTSPHEIRGLLMMYGGLRIGEACAITSRDVARDKLNVTRQVQQLHTKGQPMVTKVGPVKSTEGVVTIPWWLAERVATVEEMVKPDAVRESLRRAGWKLGIKLNPHMLRHWFCTRLLAEGIAISKVSAQMRHSDIAVTLRTYLQSEDSDIHRVWGES